MHVTCVTVSTATAHDVLKGGMTSLDIDLTPSDVTMYAYGDPGVDAYTRQIRDLRR